VISDYREPGNEISGAQRIRVGTGGGGEPGERGGGREGGFSKL